MHVFNYEAMNTELEIKIPHDRYNYARSAAIDCFQRVSSLENLLSMYKIGSDVMMINTMPKGDVCKLTADTMDCIMSAFKASEMSNGAVDISLGEFFLNAKKDTTLVHPKEPRRGKFALDPDNYLIQKIEDGMIDLGSVGKGFAVDCIVQKLLEDWEIESAYISFGHSSIYAYGKPDNADTWNVTLDEAGKISIPINNAAIGASGTLVLGNHIIDARTLKTPENMPFRTWAFGANAAICDAMSTAFMLLPINEIENICNTYNMSAAIQQSPNSIINIIE